MKGYLGLTIAIILGCILVFTGCAQTSSTTAPPAKAPASASQVPALDVPPPAGITTLTIEILGAAQGGTGWALGQAYAAIINKYAPKWLKATAMTTKGATDNMITLFKDASLRSHTVMYSSEPTVDAGLQGLKSWGFPEKVTVRPLMLAHAGTGVTPVATLNPNIKKWSDLAGKKIVTSQVGSTAQAIMMDMVRAGGFNIEPINVALSEAPDLLISGQADGAIAGMFFAGADKGQPNAQVITLLSQKPDKISFVTIPKEVVDKASKDNSIGYVYMEFPPKYIADFLDYPIGAVTDNMCWGVFPEFPEEVAYLITKIAYEHAEDFVTYHAVGAGSSRAAMTWISSPQNVHKGALKFYQEKGLKIEMPAKPLEALKAAMK